MIGNDLFRIVSDLGCDFGVERSIKLSRKKVNMDRYLLSIHRDDLGITFDDFMHRLDVPEMAKDDLNRRLLVSTLIHVSHEGGARPLRKLYLEDVEGVQHSFKANKNHLLHLALKWDQTGATAFTRYWFDPNVTTTDVLRRLESSGSTAPSVDFAMILFGSIGMGRDEVMTLRVEEEGTSRRSWDFNLYRVEADRSATTTALMELCDRYLIDDASRGNVLDALVGQRLGHLSIGTNKAGEDFTTIYFGVKPGRERLRA